MGLDLAATTDETGKNVLMIAVSQGRVAAINCLAELGQRQAFNWLLWPAPQQVKCSIGGLKNAAPQSSGRR